MRLTTVILIASLMQVSASSLAQHLTLNKRQISLENVFREIHNQTGYEFLYNRALIKKKNLVNINVSNEPIESVLKKLTDGMQLQFSIEDKMIVIKEFGFFDKLIARFQAVDVKGRVLDSEGQPLAGATVLVKGTNNAVKTDQNGDFDLRDVEENALLTVSYIGYQTTEFQTGSKTKGKEIIIKLQQEIRPLDEVLIGGNLVSTKRKADVTSVTVIDSKTLEKLPVNTIDQIFRGLVPGTNSFNVGDAPEGFPSLSIRGASSPTSLSDISVYVDGIEYAGGSGYLAQLDKNNIDRIEVVRGPGAATMYGTGSNGGIVQIFTKKGKAGESSVNITTAAGVYKSKWMEKDPFQQMHTLETRTSYNNVALTLGGSYRTVDAYLPGGGEKNKGFYGGARFNLGKLQANVIARYNLRNFSYSRNPSYDTATHVRKDILIPGTATPAYQWFGVSPTVPRNKKGATETNIAGLNLSYRASEVWVNNLDAGFTTNNSEEQLMQTGTTPYQTRYTSAKNKATTVRYSNTLNLGSEEGIAAVITSGAEYKKYASATTITRATLAQSKLIANPDNKNYAAFVQANPSYKNVYLTMGLRYEKNEIFDGAWNPKLGLTTNFDTKSLTFKPRISWGKGITTPPYEAKFGTPASTVTVTYPNPDIKPQSQQGFDYGLEIYSKKGDFRFEAVYYDNMIKDMISSIDRGMDPTDPNIYAFSYANIAKVANKGWEFSGEYQVKRFNLKGTFSIMNATMADTTGAYTLPQLADKGPGERLVNLPRHTAGLNVTYNFFKLFRKADKGALSFNLTEVDGVKSLDYLNYVLDVSYGRAPYDENSAGYPVEQKSPVFRLGINFDYNITNNLRFFGQGSNILNSYKYEYASDYPTHGATWLFGFKYNFTKSVN